ncbi:zinc finger RNA-binding protein [Procambarus clarkii]|uniref:zinc finger RNA-binding protein n=1 Tax=Procambarus clarkii TaxID=6728 RepID=UPI001E676437|nr:uncharacterized protein LOC123767951 [Procambarus clarkii]
MSNWRCESPSEPRDPRSTSVLKAVRDGILIQSYAGQQETYRCIVCSRCMSGAVPAQSHVEGFPHAKALRSYRNGSDLLPPVRAPKYSYDNADNYSNWSDPDGYELPTSFGRKRNYGSMQSSKSKSRFKADPVQTAMKHGIVLEEKMGGQTFLACNVCQIKCTGETSMHQHLQGEPHCKKQKRMEMDQDIAGGNKSDDKSSSSATAVKPRPHKYDDDDSSASLLDYAIEDGTVILTEGSTLYLTCTVCRSSCSGEAPMIQHLQGNNHQKKLRTPWQM